MKALYVRKQLRAGSSSAPNVRNSKQPHMGAAMTEEQDQTSKTSTSEETGPVPVHPTEAIPSATEPEPAPSEPASLHDVAATTGSYARGLMGRLSAFLSAHGLATAIVAALCVVAVLGMGALARTFSSLPDDASVRRDVQSSLAVPAYSGGAYGHDEPLSLVDVRIDRRTRGASGSGTYQVDVTASYSNGMVDVSQEATLTYGRTDGAWTCSEATPKGSALYATTSGTDAEKLVANAAGILQRADSSQPDAAGSVSLSRLYEGADVSVVEQSFDADAQTEAVTLHFSKASTFTSYECDVKASFAFRPGNGLWELTSAAASGNAREATLSPLVGSWAGSFQGQVAAEGRCFGAKEAGLRVSITSADSGHISGTLSVVAHFHGEPASDQQGMEGDTQLTDVPFTGAPVSGEAGLSFLCTIPDDAGGGGEMNLVFGPADDPDGAHATITTYHTYTTSFLFIPYEREAIFSDTFALTRE